MNTTHTIQDLCAHVRAMIHATPGMTYVEIERALLMRDVETSGDLCLSMSRTPHTLHWIGMSQTFYDVVRTVSEDPTIGVYPTSPLIYYWDGKVPSLPLASSRRRGDYVKDHWLPVVFSPK